MGFSLIFFIFLSIIAISTIVIPTVLTVKNGRGNNRPRKISVVILGLLVFHWIFFLTGGYILLPENIADQIFVPVWLCLFGAGMIAALYEFKNNKNFALPLAGLSIISLLFSLFAYGIGQM